MLCCRQSILFSGTCLSVQIIPKNIACYLARIILRRQHLCSFNEVNKPRNNYKKGNVGSQDERTWDTMDEVGLMSQESENELRETDLLEGYDSDRFNEPDQVSGQVVDSNFNRASPEITDETLDGKENETNPLRHHIWNKDDQDSQEIVRLKAIKQV